MQQNASINSLSTNVPFREPIAIPQEGALFVPMTNDYLFRALLQRNNYVLKGLICSLLHMEESEITSVVITNPIMLGETIDEKQYILDINVVMNHEHLINLEMQVVNQHNWPERSLCYLARNFTQIGQGKDYRKIRPVIQIGLLDYTLFPDNPEFYATYKFLNIKNHMLYSDKLQISVLDLTRTDLATEEDKKYRINHWAALFSATKWEELQMLAQDNQYFKEASETVYSLSKEEQIRQQCWAREDYYRTMNGYNNDIADLKSEISEKKQRLIEVGQELTEKEQQLAEKNQQLAEKNQQLTEKNQQLVEKDALIAALQAQLAEKNSNE